MSVLNSYFNVITKTLQKVDFTELRFESLFSSANSFMLNQANFLLNHPIVEEM